MESGLIGVLIGGVIGILGSILTTILYHIIETRKRKNSIVRIAKAEITAIKEKAERFLEGKSDLKELKSSTPLWMSLAPELGFLSADQAIAARRSITLDMEMRTIGKRGKAEECKEACMIALNLL